jgi:Mg-chelatase subunit ChlD
MARFRLRAMSSCSSLLILFFVATVPQRGVSAEIPFDVLVTADTQGNLDPCAACGETTGLGGLARRATLVRELRGASPALLVDAGNALFGEDTIERSGEAIRAAYDIIGYDAVLLSWRDFRLGREATRGLIGAAGFPFISANIIDSESGELLARPYVVKELGASRIAVVGVTEAPAGIDHLAHLRRQLAGIQIRPLAEALAEWLPRAREEANDIVLLYYGTARGLRSVVAQHGSSLRAIAVGGIRPAFLPRIESGPPLAAVSDRGRHIARLRLAVPSKQAPSKQVPLERPYELEQTPVGASLEADPTVAALVMEERRLTGLAREALAREVAARRSNVSVDAASKTGVADAVSRSADGSNGRPVGIATIKSENADAERGPDTRVNASENPKPRVDSTRNAAADLDTSAIQIRREPKGLAGVGLAPETVNAAIDRASKFLWENLREEIAKGTPLGRSRDHGLIALALVHAGAQHRFPEFATRLGDWLRRVDARRDVYGTYECAVFCMLIEALGESSLLPKLEDSARQLVELQGPNGTWAYGFPLPDEVFESAKGDPLEVLGGVPLDGTSGDPARWRRLTEPEAKLDGDFSASQFAILGLRSTARHRVLLPESTWRAALEAYRKGQLADGGWPYEGKSSGSAYGSMTCAGVASMTIALHELGEKDPSRDPGVLRGLRWLADRFTVSENPVYGKSHYLYYLYSLERVGRILDTEFIGEHEWYPLGAKRLIEIQKDDGSWVEYDVETEDPRVPTSFGLLFLTRATAKLVEEIPRGGQGQLETQVVSRTHRFYFVLDASGSMLAELGGRKKIDIAREAVSTLVSRLPENAQVALRVYGHRKRATEAGADDDTELVIPAGALRKAEFNATLERLRARGRTPLAKSLEEAASDLRYARRDEPVTVILLTDGGEDTGARRDPIAAAARLRELSGLDIHILGFDIQREDWSAQLRGIAEAAGATYWPVSKADRLTAELAAMALGEPNGFVITADGGAEVARGAFGETRPLPEGKYGFRCQYRDVEYASEFWVNTTAKTCIRFDSSKVSAIPRAEENDAEPVNEKKPILEAKFCSNCGKAIQPKQRFCTHCGTPLRP